MSDQRSHRHPVPAAAASLERCTLPRRFEALAAAQPRAPLVVYGEWRLSYRDVNSAANRLAHRLMALGVTRNVPVGLCLDRGPDLLVAILAVLKAGGAYVPLDPQWPADRLRRMRAAVDPRVLVSRTVFLAQFADHAGPVVDLDRDQSAIAAASAANPEVPIDLAQWCYVLFTSGSTGTPKGVPITHGNLIGLFPPLTAALEFGPGDVWTWFHSASFGFSVWEVWGALLHGGSIVIVPETIRQDPAALGELIAEERVTVFSQTPSAFRRVLHDARFHSSVAGSRLRYLALSGEAIRPDDIAGWLARGHKARLINTYAVTETAGQVALRVYGDGDATEEGARNLGQPLAGRELLVLDAVGLPVPAGTAGELWVGGACVTPGYVAAPEQASRFSEIAVPGGGIVRGYRSGDRVRQLADGSLEYLGRVDAQLKFRGYRIEPGDIEAALRDHPGVRDAAVGLRPDAAGNQRLTAWVVAGESSVPALSRSGALEFWPSLGAYGIYDEWLYGLMNTEPVRLAAYRAAFAEAVPGKVVLDIGTGEDAVLARLCVEAGAAHVYAVEVLEAAARGATELVRRLGMQDRITVLHGDVADLDLPQAVDVCTQGIIGNIGSADGISSIWNSARRHFAAGCVPVPARCVTRIAALELPVAVRAGPRFGPLAADYARRLFASVGQPFDLRLCVRNVGSDDLLTTSAEFEVLDFSGELPTTHAGEAELRVTRDGLLDGCLLWTVVDAGAGQTVDYFREQRAWLPVYLPLEDEPLPVRRGDRLHLRWASSLQSDARFPDYAVTATLVGEDGAIERTAVTRHRSSVAGGTRLHRKLLAQLAVKPASALPPTVTDLRRWLDARVPEHLVPQSWAFLAELPLGPGDKLDREALPAPGTDRPQLAAKPVAPRSAAEQAIADLWTEVTGLEALGVEDDFFELGGDSITAVQLITRLQRWLDAGVPLAALFDTPTIAGLAQYLQGLFPDALAAALSRAALAATTDALAPDPKVPPESTRTPLTFSQRSLWFLHDLYPGDTSASEQFAIRLGGPLDRAALARAWDGVVRRHPILTATFHPEGEMGTCLISGGEMRHVPISGDDGLLAAAESELREPFDLHGGPPVRALLCALASESHVLLVTAHHIVADGLSVPVLQADLAQRYVAEAGGESTTVPAAAPAKLSYADLAVQPAWQQGMADPEALAWWRQQLADLPPPALQELVRPHRAPHNAPRLVPLHTAPRLSRRVPFTIDAAVADGLRHLARATGATPYMVLLAAFRTLLVRLTAQTDICIGTPMTLRDTPELRCVVGCLVNPVVLRARVDVRQSFRAHLQTERSATLDAFRYRNVPFARVVEAVAPARELGVHPLFQILFSWEPATAAISTADGIEFDLVALAAARSSYFDLECALRDAGEGAGMSGHFAWSTAVLEDWVAEQLPRRFCALLADVLARPDTPIERLALLTAPERQRLLVEWNATEAALPAARTLHESFLAAAERRPEAIAIRDERGNWSYAELAARSAALAAEIAGALARRGVGAGCMVGVALGRSPELVFAVLAVLRAGAIVVPLDPGFPRARLQFMARDADLALVLTRSATLPDGVQDALRATGTTVLDLDGFQPDARVDARVPMPAVADDAPAMMLYTSGSTGEPKGGITTHQSAINRCHWMWTTFGFRDDEVFSLRTSLNFIDSWWEIFGALAHGVTLQIVPDDVATDPLRLPGFLADRGVTQLVVVPSLLRALLEQLSADEQRLPALRWCITSGEPLTPDLLAECARLLPGTAVLNTYGTSEIWDATAFDTRQLAGIAARVPIGRPIANARVYVVDAAGEPLPTGFPGELQVAGFGIGPGYWRRPELTAEKFGRLVLPEVSEALVYRTGDRARFLPDGQIECLGRLDAQFKLRGQRIEPAEIEQAIAAHPAVAAAVVGLAREGSTAVLVAGVVRSASSTLPATTLVVALRLHLQALLPAWMVPTEWLELPALPRTPTGKLDRRDWLVSVAGATRPVATAGAPLSPPSDIEQQLVMLWSAVLGRDDIGVHDNFFDLGGHSLLAARLLNRIRLAFGVSLELRALFATPTVAGLSIAIEAVRAARGAPSATPALPAPEPATKASLSFGQERLWFLDQLDPGSPAYNVAWTIRCVGPLDVAALRAALDAVVARHPALRTRFPAIAGRPTAVIDPAAPVALVVRDLSGRAGSAGDLPAELARIARASFVLDREPLFRATLLKTGAHEHHLVLVAQHIVTDATSNHLLFADLVSALACATKGETPPWAALPLTYTDYVRRQRAQANSPRLAASLAWWRQRLAGAPAALELPSDRPRPAEQRFVGAWLQRLVPPSLEEQLRGYSKAQGCTSYMVLLAAFKALLHRYTGAVDVLVGTPVEGRLTADVEPVVGLFINTLVMRTDLSGDPSFCTLLARVRDTTLDAQAHQEVPFEQLVEVLAPERSLRRSPVFQVMFNLVQLPLRSRTIGDLELRVDKLIDQGVASFDLTLTAAVEPGRLALTFEYATDLFDARTIEDFAAAYLTLLQGALRNPGQAVSRLPLLAVRARQAVLALGQSGDAAPLPVLVHDQVARQAHRWPDAVAVVTGGPPTHGVHGNGALSYAALDAQANRLARHLLTRDAGSGARIGICLPRTPDYLVAVLAVLKSGAAYVPLDPDYPAERLAGMIADASLSGLIVNSVTRDVVESPTRRVDLDADHADINRQPATDPSVSVQPGDAAYLLYTSGSTGRPKGVLVSHENLARALAGWQSAYGLQPGEAHLQMASAAFDVFSGDWVRALGTGGRLVLCPRDVLLDPPALLALLRTATIRVAEFVPAVIRLLIEYCETVSATLPGLRLLIVGSDHWYGAELDALRRISLPGTRLLNSYGVAEATIDSSWFDASLATVDGPVPVGNAMPGTTLYVLDAHGEPVPRGVPGELYVGGGGVAIGYWNDPALTAAKFRADPFAEVPGAQLYGTGDRARWNRAGQLELLGRSDSQFKLRGFRIEPAEIEACLSALPDVAAAAVGLKSPPGAEPRVVAWVVCRIVARDATGRSLHWQQQLRHQLPEHMVPAAFIELTALPLTPNGKVDRAALAALPAIPSSTRPAPTGAPANSAEATICRLYAELLGVDAVGVNDDFFRAGGHSLLATRLVARLRVVLKLEVPLRLVFESPTPRGLAAALVASQARADPQRHRTMLRSPSRRARAVDDAVPLSAMQQRLWFLERLQPGTPAYHLHWLLRVQGPLDRAALQAAVDALVARHEVLRTAFTERAGVPGQVIAPQARVPIELMKGADAATIRELIARPFNLAVAPLLRVTVLENGPRDHRLLIVMHHLVADGWSFSVLSRELAAVYNAVRHDRPVNLPRLPLQYADYAFWQQAAIDNGSLTRQVDFWRNTLADAPPWLKLSAGSGADGPAAIADSHGAWLERLVPAATVAALRELAGDSGCTLFMVLLAGFKAVLGRLAGTSDVLVGTPVAGRSHSELEDLIGFFVNTLVLRTDLNGEPTFRQLLGRVRQTTLQAFEHADVPFEKLVEVLQPRRSLAHSPLVQVLFALHNQPQQPLELDGLLITPEHVASNAAKFDLNLHAAEEGATLRLALAWRTGLYSAKAANGLLDHYVGLLQRLVATPDAALSALLAPVPAARGQPSPSTDSLTLALTVTPAASVLPEATLGPVEAALREIWAALLGCREIGLDDDFFAAGGHSLLATRLIAAIADRLGVELPLISVFEAPTIRTLARRIAERQAAAPRGPAPIPRLPRHADHGGAP